VPPTLLARLNNEPYTPEVHDKLLDNIFGLAIAFYDALSINLRHRKNCIIPSYFDLQFVPTL
jgi:hypothetical protein